MITYLEVQTALENSRWDKQIVARLLPSLPQLGVLSLEFLDRMASATGGEFVAESITQNFEAMQGIGDAINKGNADSYIPVLLQIASTAQYKYGKYILPIIFDIRLNNGLYGKIGPDLSDTFDSIELKYFDELPPREIAAILNNRLLWYMNNSNILMELKRYFYYQTDGQDTDLQRKLVYALETNTQKLGNKDLEINKQMFPPVIGKWLEDFSVYTAKERFRGGAYTTARYMQNGPNKNAIDENQSKILARVFLLYSWLLNPIVDKVEISVYEKELEGEEPIVGMSSTESADGLKNIDRPAPSRKIMRDIGSKPINAPQTGYVTAPSPSFRPGLAMNQSTNVVLDDEEQRLESIRTEQKASIESKLEELRKRKGQ